MTAESTTGGGMSLNPTSLVSGGSFAATQFYWSNYQESGLVDIVSALVSLVATALWLKARIAANSAH